MNRISLTSIVMILFFNCAWAQELQENEIIYTFNILKENPNQLNVNVEFLGDESGRTEISLPWDGYNKYIVDQNVNFSVEDGYQIQNFENNLITVLHQPYAKFKLIYSISHDQSAVLVQAPYIQPDFFSFHSHLSLIHPGVDLNKKIKITLDLSSVDEEYEVYTNRLSKCELRQNANIVHLH